MAPHDSMIKSVAGLAATALLPRLRAEVEAGDMSGPHPRVKRMIAHTLITRLNAEGDQLKVQRALTGRWRARHMPIEYYDRHSDRFMAFWNGPHAPIQGWLSEFAAEKPVSQLIEIGCGDGRALSLLADRVPDIPKLVGVDINEKIVARDRETYDGNPRLDFVAADATEWLTTHAGPGSVLMSYGGVMEYIAPETISEWLVLLRDQGGLGALIVEPVDPAHDLDNDPSSRIHGTEDSFSHNHRALLEAAGLRMRRYETVTWAGIKWVMILAET
ncbi:methyltransferase domain-containing protein [Rhodobacterales bacterium HKCCE2091]|nr:methyltransferase domain-containing protein [Rhodobacterales bacterium HKCCE2091]